MIQLASWKRLGPLEGEAQQHQKATDTAEIPRPSLCPSVVRPSVGPSTMTIDGETRLNRRRRAAARSRRAIHLNRLKRLAAAAAAYAAVAAAAQIKRRRLRWGGEKEAQCGGAQVGRPAGHETYAARSNTRREIDHTQAASVSVKRVRTEERETIFRLQFASV